MLMELSSNGYFGIFGCTPSDTNTCAFVKIVFRLKYYHRPLAPDAVAVNGRAPYFKVEMWSDRYQPETDPQVEYDFVLPRILSGGEATDIITAGIWHHIAFTRDVGEQSISLYVDGQRYGRLFDSEIVTPLDLTIEDDYRLAFGGQGYGRGGPLYQQNEPGVEVPGSTTWGDDTLNGYMDDIRITRGIVYRNASFDVPTEAHPLTP